MEWMEVLADTTQYLSVGLIGGCVGIAELVSRYKDDPYEAIRNRHAVLYTTINVLAALIALLALKTLGFDGVFGEWGGEKSAASRIGYTLVAGFGAMGILRSSAFTLRTGNEDVSIGPSALLQIILSATDRAVDRARATVRAERMAKTMVSLQFSQIHTVLPQLAFSMMQNVSSSEKQDLADELARLQDQQDMDPTMKSICLGLALSNIVGQRVVDAAVAALRQSLKPVPEPVFTTTRAEPPAPPASPPGPA
jgi:hypothetical protein